jgi:hypothetical protein
MSKLSIRKIIAFVFRTYKSQNFSDVWGPAPLFSSDDYRYFVIFVDMHKKYIWYYPLVAKSDVYFVFHQF